MVDITVEGYAKPLSCSAEDEWTVEEAENKIRSAYLLSGGHIQRNGKVTKSTHKIQEGADIAYVHSTKFNRAHPNLQVRQINLHLELRTK
jgi:hypothetical protein